MKKSVYKETIPTVGKLIIRYPTLEDVKLMTKYINELSREKTYVLMQGEKMTVQQERDFVVAKLKSIRQQKSVLLLAFLDNELVGVSAVDAQSKVESHVGVFGISIKKEYRGQGLGKKVMATVLEEAKSRIKGLKLIRLGVFESNEKAQKMYRDFGFKEYGRLPGGIHYREKYIDHVYMFLEIQK